MFINKICPICGQHYYLKGAGVQCGKFNGVVCMAHCQECRNLINWQCTYKKEFDKDRLLNHFYKKHFLNEQKEKRLT